MKSDELNHQANSSASSRLSRLCRRSRSSMMADPHGGGAEGNDWIFRRQISYSEFPSTSFLFQKWRRRCSGSSGADEDVASVGCCEEEILSVSPEASSSLRLMEPSNSGLDYLKRGTFNLAALHTDPLNSQMSHIEVCMTETHNH